MTSAATAPRYAMVALAATVGSATLGRAAVSVDYAPSAPSYTVPASNLFATATVSTTGEFTKEGGAGTAILTDGSFGPAGNGDTPGVKEASASAGAAESITYTFDTTSNVAGYDLMSIATYTGWDAARVRQQYTVAVSTVAAPGVFVPLAEVENGGIDFSGAITGNATMITDTTGTLATGVKSVRFSFGGLAFVDHAFYREISAAGAASVPEPATLGLLAVGGLLIRRRRV